MPRNPEATVTLTVEAWKVIMGFVTSSCQAKSEAWMMWGRELNQIIQSSVDNALGASHKKQGVSHKPIRALPRLTNDEFGSDDNIDEVEVNWDQAAPDYDEWHDPDFGEWVNAGDHWVWDPYTGDDD